MRTYTYASGDSRRCWRGGASIEARRSFTPGGLLDERGSAGEQFVHTWVYKDLTERTASVGLPHGCARGPPQTGVRPIRPDNKLLMPAGLLPRAVVARRADRPSVRLGGRLTHGPGPPRRPLAFPPPPSGPMGTCVALDRNPLKQEHGHNEAWVSERPRDALGSAIMPIMKETD